MEKRILTHNKCRSAQRKAYWKKEAKELKGNGITYDVKKYDNLQRMTEGKAPRGFDRKKVELHHVNGIKNDFDTIVQIQRTDHIKFHREHGYRNFPDIRKIEEFLKLIR